MEYITHELLKKYAEIFLENKQNLIASHAVMNSGIEKTSIDIDVVRRNRNTFSLQLKQGEITDQQKSGRCWMFAALNIMRYAVTVSYTHLDVYKRQIMYHFRYSKVKLLELLVSQDVEKRPLAGQ